MLIHWYDQNGMISLYEEPRPEPAPGVYLGTIEMSAEELLLLDERIEEVEGQVPTSSASPTRP